MQVYTLKTFLFFLVFGSYIKDWPQRYLCKFCGWCNMYMTHTTNSCFSCSAGQNPSSCGEGSSADLPEIQAVPGTLRRTHGELRPLMKCSLIPVCRWEFYFLPVIPWYGYICLCKVKSHIYIIICNFFLDVMIVYCIDNWIVIVYT